MCTNDLPYIEEYDDVLDEYDEPLLNRIREVWTDEMSDKFYEEWDIGNCTGAILDDYFYILEMYLGRNKTIEIFGRDLFR